MVEVVYRRFRIIKNRGLAAAMLRGGVLRRIHGTLLINAGGMHTNRN